MVKVRMNTADVAAEVKCLRRLIGMRCSNVYDLSPKVPFSIILILFPFFTEFVCVCFPDEIINFLKDFYMYDILLHLLN